MKNNKLIVYKESIFSKISNFFKKAFNISSKDENKIAFKNINYSLQKDTLSAI